MRQHQLILLQFQQDLQKTPCTIKQTSPTGNHEKGLHKKSSDETARAKPADSTPQLTRSRSGRVIKPPTNSDFVYNWDEL